MRENLARRAALHALDELVVLGRGRFRVEGYYFEENKAVSGEVLRRGEVEQIGPGGVGVEGTDERHFAAHAVEGVRLELAFEVRVDAGVRVGGA